MWVSFLVTLHSRPIYFCSRVLLITVQSLNLWLLVTTVFWEYILSDPGRSFRTCSMVLLFHGGEQLHLCHWAVQWAKIWGGQQWSSLLPPLLICVLLTKKFLKSNMIYNRTLTNFIAVSYISNVIVKSLKSTKLLMKLPSNQFLRTCFLC